MAVKRKSRQKPQARVYGDIPVPASQCRVGDMVALEGRTMRLTAINDSYAILRESDAKKEIEIMTPCVMVRLIEPYSARVGGGGKDPLSGE